MLNKQRTMIITPHLDDVEFGMGGTLVKLCKEHPENVKVLVLCEGRDEKNALARLSAFAKNIHLLGFHRLFIIIKIWNLNLFHLKKLQK